MLSNNNNNNEQQPSKKQKLENHQINNNDQTTNILDDNNNNNNNNDNDSDNDNDEDNNININNDNNSNNYIDNIDDLEYTLINLVNIVSQYNQIKHQSDYRSISNKIKYIQYFNNYHDDKYPHYYNFNSFIDFVLDIFFDDTIIIFEQIQNINYNYGKDILYNCIINDKRFKEWFKSHYENDIRLLKYKFKLINEEFFNIETLHSLLFNNNLKINNNNNNRHPIINNKKKNNNCENNYEIVLDNQYRSNKIKKMDYYDHNSYNLKLKKDYNNSDNINRKSIILPDHIIQNILSHSIERMVKIKTMMYERYVDFDVSPLKFKELFYIKESLYFIYDISKLSNYAMVSKQFLKVFSNLFNHQILKENYFYRWVAFKLHGYIRGVDKELFRDNENDGWYKRNSNGRDIIQESTFEFINQQNPLVFHYETIRSIPYDISKEKLELIFSKVETFFINSDEYDISITDSDNFAREFSRWCTKFRYHMDDKSSEIYNQSILSLCYLVIPPPMPSLKNIIVSGYYGYEVNYSNLLSDILSNFQKTNNYKSSISIIENPQEFENQQKENKFECCSGGIEFFSIELNEDWDTKLVDQNLLFVRDLLFHNSKSINRIDIIMKKTFRGSVIEILDEIIGLENNKLDLNIIIYEDYRKPQDSTYIKYLKYINKTHQTEINN